ncbi:protein YABBY 7-like [Phragmites australis]|uniref:protein YABBY 7-like n=1 Tax=Phragmites australis TaxID=29695 RepID=UPI002D77B1A7|nr:protein YABBY 7-like [Phragmites australis]
MSSVPVRHPCFGLEVQERLGYVQCNFCATILLVSMPCAGMQLKTVAVQCGSCAGILSVTMPPPAAAPASVELPLQEPGVDPPPRDSDESSGEDREMDAAVAENNVFPSVNKPPARKQRTPSAYNCFIKEEIRRIKARDPSISHKQAFSTASKNWAHLPRIQ